MRVYLLRFQDPNSLSDAFATVADDNAVASCVLDASELRLRFAAPDSRADQLVERIYEGGGLCWSSKHDLRGLEGQFGTA